MVAQTIPDKATLNEIKANSNKSIHFVGKQTWQSALGSHPYTYLLQPCLDLNREHHDNNK